MLYSTLIATDLLIPEKPMLDYVKSIAKLVQEFVDSLLDMQLVQQHHTLLYLEAS